MSLQTKVQLPQSKDALLKSYNKHLKDDIRSIVDNFTEIIKLGRIAPEEDGQVGRLLHITEDQYEMHVRAANIVRAGESLMKLIADIKQYLILNDFPSVNEAISKKTQLFRAMQLDCDTKLITLRDDINSELYELEDEYYSSLYK